MPISITQGFPVGSVWSTSTGDKAIVLAHDFVSDSILAYNYRTKEEFFIDRKQVDDNLGFVKKWDETVAYENGLFDGMREQFTTTVQKAFCGMVQNEEGIPQGYFRETIMTKDGPADIAHEYKVYGFIAPMRSVSRVTLLARVHDFERVIENDVVVNKIHRIVWRTFPELHLHHDELSGVRKLKLYARFVGFSGNETVDFSKLKGHCGENGLTPTLV